LVIGDLLCTQRPMLLLARGLEPLAWLLSPGQQIHPTGCAISLPWLSLPVCINTAFLDTFAEFLHAGLVMGK
jgi:hypothetical protein